MVGGAILLYLPTVTLEVLELRSSLVLLGLRRASRLVRGRLGVGDARFGSGDGLGLFALVGLATVPCASYLFAAVVKTLDGGHRRAWSCMFCLTMWSREVCRLGQS